MNLCNDCVKELLESFLDNAKEMVEKEDCLPGMAFPLEFDDNDELEIRDPYPVAFRNDEEKIYNWFEIGAHCWMSGCYQMVVGMDGCSVDVPDDKKEEFMKNFEFERPTLYPHEARNNFIILTFIDTIDEDFKTMICKYKKENNKMVFDEPVFLENGIDSFAVSFIIRGWDLFEEFLGEDEEELK